HVTGVQTCALPIAFLRWHDPEIWPLLREGLMRMGRAELIGNGPNCLVPRHQPAVASTGYGKSAGAQKAEPRKDEPRKDEPRKDEPRNPAPRKDASPRARGGQHGAGKEASAKGGTRRGRR